MPGRLRVQGVDWWLAEGQAPDALRALLARSVRAWRSGGLENRKTGRRKALYGLRLAGPEGREGEPAADHLLKVTRYGWGEGFRRRVRGSKARHELARAEAVRARGLPTPVPCAAGEWRVGGCVRACLLLVPVVPDVTDLRVLAARDLAPAMRRRLARAFGELARRMAEAGVFQDDFAPNNFLVRPDAPEALQVIDFERARLRGPVAPRARRFMLAKLHREMPTVSRSDRMRFLRAYTGRPAAARILWRTLQDDLARLAARDLARMARTATRGGRRFRRLRERGARGFAWGDDEEALRLVRSAGPPGLEVHSGHVVWRAEGHGAQEARARWVRQAWLANRGLALAPRASLRAPAGRLTLVLALPHDAAPGAAGDPEEVTPTLRRAALAVLWARTLALGELEGPAPGAETVAWSRNRGGALRAVWRVAPGGLRARGRPDPGGLRRARALAREVLPHPGEPRG